tara:strand:- start:52 stop:231 length:180 start_codon:yes stop_codon:yes gene_type:complete
MTKEQILLKKELASIGEVLEIQRKTLREIIRKQAGENVEDELEIVQCYLEESIKGLEQV